MSKVMTTLCAVSCASLILFVGAGQVQAQYIETFESLNNGDGVANLPNWSGDYTADRTAELGGRAGLVGQASGYYDLSGAGLLPPSNYPAYNVVFDAYVFPGTGNQFSQARSPATRLWEIQWTGSEWNWRTFASGGTNEAQLPDPDSAGGLRKVVVSIDAVANTAQAIIQQQGLPDLDLGAFPFETADMDRILIGGGNAGNTMQVDTFSVIVPEPSTMMLVGAGLFGLALGWRRRRNR